MHEISTIYFYHLHGSLFYYVIYTNTEAESPKDLSMNINGEFIEKFNLLDDSDFELH
jgi:hypothetical protein